jgi:uncharacterized membrane protein
MNKALKLAFVASIVLNVLLIGVFAGQLPRRFDRTPSRQQRMENFIKTLSDSAQARFREKMKNGDPIRNELRQARSQAIAILGAESFDENAYDRQVSRINELRVQLADRLAADIKEIAKELTPEQRKALADALQRPPRPAG